MAAKIF